MNPDLDNDFEDLDNEISRLLGAEPWARQKEEGNWEYAGFQIYRNAGSKRTLQMVAHGIEAKRHDARMKANIVEPSPSLGEHEYGQILKEVEQWERKNHWARRSKAWDAEMHEQYEELARCDEIKNDKSEDEAGSALLAIAAIHLVHLNKSLKDPEKLLELASISFQLNITYRFCFPLYWRHAPQTASCSVGFDAGRKGAAGSVAPVAHRPDEGRAASTDPLALSCGRDGGADSAGTGYNTQQCDQVD